MTEHELGESWLIDKELREPEQESKELLGNRIRVNRGLFIVPMMRQGEIYFTHSKFYV